MEGGGGGGEGGSRVGEEFLCVERRKMRTILRERIRREGAITTC